MYRIHFLGKLLNSSKLLKDRLAIASLSFFIFRFHLYIIFLIKERRNFIMNNSEKFYKVLDTLIDFVKLDDFSKTSSDDPESTYAKLIYMVNHGDTRLI